MTRRKQRFFNCACAVRGGIPVRMLEINPEQANASDGDVIIRKSLFANDLRKRRKNLNFYAGRTAILNIEFAS